MMYCVGVMWDPGTVVKKILRTGYFWTTMTKDTNEAIRKCHNCQIHSYVLAMSAALMMSISTPWPSYNGIVELFPEAPGKVKFLRVVIDNLTKWVEAELVLVIS